MLTHRVDTLCSRLLFAIFSSSLSNADCSVSIAIIFASDKSASTVVEFPLPQPISSIISGECLSRAKAFVVSSLLFGPQDSSASNILRKSFMYSSCSFISFANAIYLIGARLWQISSNRLFLDEGLSPRRRGSPSTLVNLFIDSIALPVYKYVYKLSVAYT